MYPFSSTKKPVPIELSFAMVILTVALFILATLSEVRDCELPIWEQIKKNSNPKKDFISQFNTICQRTIYVFRYSKIFILKNIL
jgi:hypothetical protein